MGDCVLVDKFCLCYSLQSGGKLIAGLCVGLSMIASIFLIMYLFSDPDEIAREIASDDANVESLKENSTSARVCAGVVLILSLLLLVSSVLLHKGISNKSKKLFMPFLETLGISILFLVVISIIQFEAGGLFAALTFLVLLIYLFICIFSLYNVIDASTCDQRTDIDMNQQFSP